MAWVQGAYVYNAIGALAPALKAFAKGRAKPYLEHPFMNDAELDVPKRKEESQSDEKARAWMEMWAINFNEKFDEKKLGGEANG